jgi:tRNA-dihydrouridine synthase
MVEMARRVVAAVSLPVTVKTRIGWGPESDMPIVDLARRLEDVGVAGLTIHCRTAQMGHEGQADWRWAARARGAVAIPVVVNGDVRSAGDAARALAETGCAGVMVGRAAIDYPWIFREAQALLDGRRLAPASDHERVETYRWLAAANADARGERFGVEVTRRHLGLLGPRLRPLLQKALYAAKTVAAVGRVLDGALAAPVTSSPASRPA